MSLRSGKLPFLAAKMSFFTIRGYHPPFLILDTPKQHELHAADLGAFVQRFEKMIAQGKKLFQLIIGATEEDFTTNAASCKFWRPKFGTVEEPRFLGIPGSEFKEPELQEPKAEPASRSPENTVS